MQEGWSKVDAYMVDKLVFSDPVLEHALTLNAEKNLPPHDVSPNQGKFLHLIARMCGAKRILEIGTLGGYSTIWMSRALPAGGKLITLEANAAHAEVARINLSNACLNDRVDVRVGLAMEELPKLIAEAPFDLIFIDADKPNNPGYLEWAIKLSRVGTVIIGDNVVRDGAIADPNNADPRVQGVRKFFDMIAQDPRLTATALQTVGSKGWDGFALALVN